MGEQQVGTATILFTDLVGSTELRAQLGEHAADELRRRHDEALAAAVASGGGTVVKGLGDGIMAVFSGAADAIAAGVAMQRAVGRLSRRYDGDPLAIRVGISAGDVTWADDDCFGEPVIEASRLCDAAEAGRVLCSAVVQVLARGRAEHPLRPVGDLELKGLPEPVSACEVVWTEGAPDFPLPTLFGTRSPFPFVGRTNERADLRSAWKRAVAGEGSLVFIGGEPGVGKSRLAGELARAVHDDGGVVVAGRCDEEIGMAYQPFVEALGHFVRHCPAEELRDRLGASPEHLARLVPEVGERVGELDPVLSSDEDTDRQRLFEACTSWLAASSSEQPTLLVLDDVHWAGRPSLLLLRHLLRSLTEMRVLVVGTYRDTDLDRSHPLAEVLADLRREAGVSRVLLRGLSAAEVVEFLEGAAGHALPEAGQQLARALHTETEGNPFFLEEVLSHLIEIGLLYQDESGQWTSDLDSIDEFGIPEGVREVVGRRLSRLSEDCNRVLGVAAVLGPAVDLRALREMVDRDVVEPLEEAERAGLISEAEGAVAGYSFTHALVRQTLLEELSLARRQQYHLRAAEALEQTGVGTPAQVASHYRQAGAAASPDKAVAASLVAAEAARQQLAWEEASEQWEAALELLDVHGGDPAEKARLLQLLGDAMYATGRDWQQGLDQLERAVEILDEMGDDYGAAKVRSRIARNLASFPGRDDPNRAFAHLEAAEPALRARGDSPALAYLRIGFATAHTFRLEYSRGADAAREALEIGERIESPVVCANARLLLGWHLGGLGRTREALELLDEGYEEGIRLQQPIIAFLGAWLTNGVLSGIRDPAAAEDKLVRELESGRFSGAPGLRRSLQGAIQAQRLSQGFIDIDDSEELWEGWVLLGRWDRARETAARSEVEFARAGNEWNRQFCCWLGSRVDYLEGDHESCIARLAPSIDRLRDTELGSGWVYNASLMVSALVALDRNDEAGHHARECATTAARFDELRGLEALEALTAGLVAADRHEADGHFARGVEVARRYRIPWTEAEVFEAWGRSTGRVEHFDAAAVIYDRIGAADVWLERLRRLRHEAVG